MKGGNRNGLSSGLLPPFTVRKGIMKRRIVTLLLTLLTILSLLPTAAMAAESTGVGITPVTNPDLWTTRLNSNGQTYSYRPPTAAGRQLWCMDLGLSLIHI